MKNHRLAKFITDTSWGCLANYLEYKCRLYSKKLGKVNPKNTSQACSRYREIVLKTLSVRIHKCFACSLVLDRDNNGIVHQLKSGLYFEIVALERMSLEQ